MKEGFGFSTQGEQGTEIRIGGDDNPIFSCGQPQDVLVIGSLEVSVSDMNGVVPNPPQLGGH